ncbi:MAG: tRNA (adenosine(37)-N6)-threonylcarbamoyltransferase complex transferase subunit TsaD [Elusimicrobia bacterium RIFOXYB2_FULL_49_7]|nr:MAG: tRNA (adenosine(37)-N6)-threonylcarbamoyltransferase complex transferase subunit TsaD [Elusimicrobia bacterium RIFOXYB2_FULL_49_7]
MVQSGTQDRSSRETALTMYILGIETSCDETSAAILSEDFKVYANVIHSQTNHARFGGVVPEIASREHCVRIEEVVRTALTRASLSSSDIGLVCATSNPGLIGALLVGLSFARGFAWSHHIPFVSVNHLDGHIKANIFTDPKAVQPPYIALLVSGGHTFLVRCGEEGRYSLVGNTLDDAAGEALDKAGKLMGLPYPAGRRVEELASTGNPFFAAFPRALPGKDNLNFSFSGLKTALKNFLKTVEPAAMESRQTDILASFQEAVMDVLARKSLQAMRIFGDRKLLLAGGVACNGLLRKKLTLSLHGNQELYFPTPEYCTDNGAMIAAAGLLKYRRLGADTGVVQASAVFNITEVNYES